MTEDASRENIYYADNVRRRIQVVVAIVVFVIGALLECAHYFDLTEHFAPEWLLAMINEKTNFFLMVAGILVYVFTKFEERSENHKLRDYGSVTDAPAKLKSDESQKELTGHSVAPQNRPSIESIAVSPKINASPTYNQTFNLLHPEQVSPRASPDEGRPTIPEHNVKPVGARIFLMSETFEEATAGDRRFSALKYGYRNDSILGTRTSALSAARARMIFRNKVGEEIAEVSRAKWLKHDVDDLVEIAVNSTEWFIIASFINGSWTAPSLESRRAPDWAEQHEISANALPNEELSVEISVIGNSRIGLQRVKIHFILEEDGGCVPLPGT